CHPCLFLMIRPPPSSPLFPYTTLFRSSGTTNVVFLSAGTTSWPVDPCFNNSNNSVEVYGPGGNGAAGTSGTTGGAGGGSGFYSENPERTPLKSRHRPNSHYRLCFYKKN